jgi:hypothetical protein
VLCDDLDFVAVFLDVTDDGLAVVFWDILGLVLDFFCYCRGLGCTHLE